MSTPSLDNSIPEKQHSASVRGAHLTQLALCFIVAVWGVTPAGAEPDEPDETGKPWYQGVSREDREKARVSFAEGAELHKSGSFAEAVEKYREALSYWDNPDIHFNLVQAYIELGQPIEAHASLAQATRYGLDHLTAKDRVRARDYKRLLEGRLALLTIRAEQDVHVALDGDDWLTGAGSETRWVMPGPHRILAKKDEHLDMDEEIRLAAGVSRDIVVDLIPRSRLAMLVVSCAEAEAEVTLDGEPFMTCPNRVEKELMSEQRYTVAISRPGYIGAEKTVEPKPGERVEFDLATTTVGIEPSLRWARWKPLSVVGVGVAIGIAGGVLQTRAVSNMSDYDSDIDAMCGPPINGCTPDMVPAETLDKKTRAERQNRAAVGFMVGGAVGIIAGLTLVYLNEPRGARTERPSEPARTVVPIISPEGVGIATHIRF